MTTRKIAAIEIGAPAAIELVDSGSIVNAYEDREGGRILATLQRPRCSKGPYVVTVLRTQECVERASLQLAYASLKRLAFAEWHALNSLTPD
jgi:hypothetical protein